MNKIEQHLEVAQRSWSFVWKFAMFAQEHLPTKKSTNKLVCWLLIEELNICYKFKH